MIFQVLLSAAGIAYGQNSNPSPGLAIALENSKSFCLIASPFGSQNIAGMEKAAKSTCFGNPSGAMPGMKMKDGLIQSAHVVKTPHYIQVTGQLNGVAGGYNPADEGTQFDDSLASQKGVLPESGCVGYPMYLEYFSGSQYCLRCCHHAFSSYCDPTHDTQGCSGGIPGDFGPGFTDTVGSPFPAIPVPVPNNHGCAPAIDSCISENVGYMCCVAKGDQAAGLSFKTTCQYKDDCVPGTGGKNNNVIIANSTSSTTSSTTSATLTSTSSTALSTTVTFTTTDTDTLIVSESTSSELGSSVTTSATDSYPTPPSSAEKTSIHVMLSVILCLFLL